MTRLIRTLAVFAIATVFFTSVSVDSALAADAKEPLKVGLFEAVDAGQVAVKLIPLDSKQVNLLIENKTAQPLSVRMPEAFAAVPVLAQFGGGGMGGGGMGGMGGGGQGMGGGGGMNFRNIPPEKVGKIKLPTVCLEHDKTEPRPAMKYEIKPINEFTDRVEVHELCRMLGEGIVGQRVAQVAAWHLNNNMSWQQLASKRLLFADGTSAPYFSLQEVRGAMQAVAVAKHRASLLPPTSPGDLSPADQPVPAEEAITQR